MKNTYELTGAIESESGRELTQMQKSGRWHKALGVVMISAMALTATAGAAVITSAGEVTGIGGSEAQDNTSTFSAIYRTGQTDGVIHIVLDLGSVQNVDVLSFVNRSISTNFAISQLEILIAADENAVGFDPYSLSSYTGVVFAEQKLNPHFTNANAVRSADIVDSKNRYFLINFTESFHTVDRSFSLTTANHDRVQFSDIGVTTIPEPGTTALIGLAFAGSLLHRWRKCLGGKTKGFSGK